MPPELRLARVVVKIDEGVESVWFAAEIIDRVSAQLRFGIRLRDGNELLNRLRTAGAADVVQDVPLQLRFSVLVIESNQNGRTRFAADIVDRMPAQFGTGVGTSH